jgi:hypothetical protein
MKKRVVIILGLITGLLLGALALTGEAQKGKERGIDSTRSKLESLVSGALKNVDRLLVRAENMERKAVKYKKGTRKWFSLMNTTKRSYRVAYNSLAKYRKVKVSPTLKVFFDKSFKEVTKRLVKAYENLINEYMAAGSRSTAARLLSELKKVDARAVKKLKPGLVARVSGKKDKEIKEPGRRINPRTRAGRRLTGEEARWLGRRGVQIGGGNRGSSTPPRTPAPRGPGRSR